MSKEWNRVHVSVTSLLTLDWLVPSSFPPFKFHITWQLALALGGFRIFRLLRPMLWVVRAREPRRVFSHVADILKPLASVLLSAIAMIVLFALLAVAMFAGTSVGGSVSKRFICFVLLLPSRTLGV